MLFIYLTYYDAYHPKEREKEEKKSLKHRTQRF